MEGRTLAHFRITTKLGAGGMGEVYRALDTRLGRDVAIKVLPPAFARDPERLGRMEREARLLAALSHPNIAAIHGLEEADGIRFLVMELVPGENLAERLVREPLTVQEALQAGAQIAAALEAAHEKGIIHRDLKPANVILAPGGQVKVLDFGLAKVLADEMPDASLSESPTLTAQATREGVVLGTAAYMSPEQARGRALDRRTDIWSFGCVLYEMLASSLADPPTLTARSTREGVLLGTPAHTNPEQAHSRPLDRRTDIWSFGCVLYEMLARRRPFGGETVSDILASILREEPDWSALPAGVPPRVRLLLARCLRKEPSQRLRDAGDARLEIDEALAGPPDAAPGSPGKLPPRRPRARAAAWALLAGALMLAVGFAAGYLGGRRGPRSPDVWSGELLVGGATIVFNPRVSPDGQMMAFQILVDGDTQVAVMKPGSGRWSVLTHAKQGTVFNLAWSSDGTRIYFDRGERSTRSVPVLGGEERVVLDGYSKPEVLPDGTLLVARVEEDRNLQYSRYWPETGRIAPLGPRYVSTNPAQQMRVFPDGKEAAFFGVPAADAETHPLPRLFIMDIATGKVRELARDLSFEYGNGQWAPLAAGQDGRWVYSVDPEGDFRRLIAIPRETGPVKTLMSFTSPVYYLDAGPDGTIYADQVVRPREILRIPATGGIPERIGRTTGSFTSVSSPVELPDGRLLVQGAVSGRRVLMAIWPGKDPSPFVETQETTSGPATMIGKDRVAFFMGNPPQLNLAIATTDGRIVTKMARSSAGSPITLAASPDGATLYYSEASAIWAVDVASGVPRRFHAGDAAVVDPRTGDLIVQLNESPDTVLVRMPAAGGEPRKVFERTGIGVAPDQGVAGNAILPDGRVLVTATQSDSWFWAPAVLDVRDGQLTRVPVLYDGDVNPSVWGKDGSILSIGWGLKTDIWRFRPMPGDGGASP